MPKGIWDLLLLILFLKKSNTVMFTEACQAFPSHTEQKAGYRPSNDVTWSKKR